MLMALGLMSLIRPQQVNDAHGAMIRIFDSKTSAPSLVATKLVGGFLALLGTALIVGGLIA
jgi:hypothetical protein